MQKVPKFVRRMLLIAVLSVTTVTGSGCTLFSGFASVTYAFMLFWKTTPLIPVTPFFQQEIEDTYWEEERYAKVPILDPVEGEHAPIFCVDPPSADEVMRALPDPRKGGMPFIAETQWNNVRILVEPVGERLGECRFYPMVGPARMHHCHYKCTVYYDKTIRSAWPIPFSHTDESQEVVYIDHNHLIRCAGPVTPRQ